jgi:hypothetical protein
MPLSRETTRVDDLKQSLALYRLTFGQPRQQELLEFLRWRSPGGAQAALAMRPAHRSQATRGIMMALRVPALQIKFWLMQVIF